MSVRSSAAKRFLKRWARRFFALGSTITGVGREASLTPGLRILTYHRVTEDPADPFTVRPSDFRAQMEQVAGTGAAMPLEEALQELGQGEGARPRIVLTFDDGTEDFLTGVLPVLQRLRLPATLYVSPARVGERGFLDWDQLRAIHGAGIRIGSHGLDHRSLGRMSLSEAGFQVGESKRILEDRLGIPVNSLAYPFGTIRDWSDGVKAALKSAGYRSACTSVNGVNSKSSDLLELSRTKIEQADGPIFKRILSGGLDGWALVDRNLAAFQNRYVS